jgi:glutathione peroxidase
MSQFYQFKAQSLDGKDIAMSDYANQVVLIVNTASECGFTPQYTGLEALYQKYRERGLVVLGFPCNQFGGQEPGTAEDIAQVCQLNFGVSFPMFAKINVNGADAHPIYQWLKQDKPGFLGEAIKWNFTKFLIGRDGAAIKRYASITKPEALEADIEAALAKA